MKAFVALVRTDRAFRNALLLWLAYVALVFICLAMAAWCARNAANAAEARVLGEFLWWDALAALNLFNGVRGARRILPHGGRSVPTLANPVQLPKTRHHAAGTGVAYWSAWRGWCVFEDGTQHVTAWWPTEEAAIRAARRREWKK